MGEVLIVEQGALLRRAVYERLLRRGYRVMETAATAAAERCLAGSSILLALIGPLSDSAEAIQFAGRVRHLYPGVAVLLYSAGPTREMLLGALRAGVRDYIVEPSPENLVAAVEHHIP